MTEDEPAAKDPSQWKGLNILGKTLTNLCESYTLANKRKNKMKP